MQEPRHDTKPDMLDEYDFRQGVRGKYAARNAAGTNVIVLPPDLARAFPTREAVVEALGGLMIVTHNHSASHHLKRSAFPSGTAA